MKKTIFLFISFLFVSNLFSQVENRFRGTLNVFGSSGSGPYIITGFFNDTQGRYSSDSTSVGDWLYMNSGDECVRFQIDSILSVAGGIVNVRVVDVDDQVVSFPSGIGGLLSETPNYGFPNFISGLSEDLLACMRTHFTEKVDLITAGGINVEDSETINHTISGDTLTSDVIISKLDSNLLKLFAGLTPDSLNGLYVVANTTNITLNKEYFGLTTNISDVFELLQDSVHVHENGETISFSERAPIGDEVFPRVSAEAIISPDGGNTLEARSNGLFSGGLNIISFIRGDAAITATDSVGVTFSSAAGTGTLSYPDSVNVFALGVSGESADLAGDNSYTIVLNKSASSGVNDGVSSMLAPVVNVINTASQLGGGPSNALPFIYDEGSSPQVQVTGVGSGDITLRVINLNAFSNWQISIRP